MNEKQTIAIILPCYNPIKGWEKNIVTQFQKIEAELPNIAWSLYLVNDGTKKEIEDSEIQFLTRQCPNLKYLFYKKNKGKGFALRHGVQMAEASFYIYTDVDFPYTIESFKKLAKQLISSKADVVIGSRDENYYKQVPPFRTKLSKAFKWCLKKLFRISVTDTQCGLKGFNSKGKAIFLQTKINRYLFDLEFIFLLNRNKKLNLKTCEVILRPNIVFSKMNVSVLFKESLSFIGLFFRNLF